MRTNSPFIPQSVRMATLTAAAAIILTSQARGQSVFFDTFDTNAVGTFPSTWTAVTTPPDGVMQVTNGLNAPSYPNAFQITNSAGENFEADRNFSAVTMNTMSQVVVGFSIRLDYLTNFNSAGAYIRINTSQGIQTFGLVRVYGTDSTGGGANWGLLDDYVGIDGGAGGAGSGQVALGLSTGVWYNFAWKFDPSPTNAQTGQIQWFLNNSLVYSNLFTGLPDITGLRVSSVATPGMSFAFDNVMVVVVPEPSPLLFGLVAAAGLAGWRTLRRRTT